MSQHPESIIFTIGYQNHTPASLVETLHSVQVNVLIDVRLTPLSRRKGFSKRGLAETLCSSGIEYVHCKELGNPKEFRRTASSIPECLKMFELHMNSLWDSALVRPTMLLKGNRIALLCQEASPADCHRTIVARELSSRAHIRVVPL